MARGYSGADAILDLELSYEYQGHLEKEFQSIANLMEINLTHATRDLSYMATDFELIKDNMVQLAKSFILQNGTYNTGNLYNSVRGEVRGQQINLSAPARDKRGHLYAGHIEFGFTDKRGIPHGPWPFLRPAVHLAAMDSRGILADEMARMLTYGPSMSMHDSTGSLSFGRTNNRTTAASGARVARNTREVYKAGKQNPNSRQNTKQWNDALHGIKSQSDSSNFIWSGSGDWDWGSV